MRFQSPVLPHASQHLKLLRANIPSSLQSSSPEPAAEEEQCLGISISLTFSLVLSSLTPYLILLAVYVGVPSQLRSPLRRAGDCLRPW